MGVLRGAVDDGLGNLLALQIDVRRPGRVRSHTLTSRRRAAIRATVTGRGRNGGAVGAGSAVQAVARVAAVFGRVRARLRAGAAAWGPAAWAAVGRRCCVARRIEAGIAGERAAIRTGVVDRRNVKGEPKCKREPTAGLAEQIDAALARHLHLI